MKKLKLLWNRLNRDVEEVTETNRVTMEGWLYKMGEVSTSWSRRWCTLNREDIKYYKVKDAYSPQGVIPLEMIAEVKSGRVAGLTEMNGEETDNGFVVITAQRTFYFVAESNSEKYEWIQVRHMSQLCTCCARDGGLTAGLSGLCMSTTVHFRRNHGGSFGRPVELKGVGRRKGWTKKEKR
jgi:hypothetical protein